MKVFYFHCNFQPHKSRAIFYENQARKGKLNQDGQMLYDSCWAIRLIAALLLTFTSHIRHSTE